MAKSQGVFKRVAYKKEGIGQWGELAGATGAKELRRTTAEFNLIKDSYSSNEITQKMQITDLRHGVRSAEGSLNGELSPGSYSDFIGSVLGKDFAAETGTASASITIAASGTNFTLTRAAGSFLTDGIKVGHVVRMTATGLNAANVGNNCLVVTVTALALTVQVLSSTSLVAEGPIASVSVIPVGKTTFVPASGHTLDSYNIEQWYADITQSEVFTGLKVGTWNVALPATGLVTTDFSFMGKDLTSTGTTAYFTSPTAATTTGLFAAVQGALIISGVPSACITDANFSVEKQLENAQCLGSNSVSEIFNGRISVTGSLSAYFSDASMRDLFDDETEATVVFALTTSEAKDADVMSIVMPRCKFNSANVADAELGLVQSIDFQALYQNTNTNGLVASTIMVQDSAA